MGAWTLIKDYTVPSNTTSVVLDDFGTITKDDFVRIEFTFVNNSGGSTLYRLFPNDNTTNTNFYRQSLFGAGTGVGAGRTNENIIGNAASGATVYVSSYVKLSENDKFNSFNNANWSISSALENGFFYTTQSTGTTTSLTSFTIGARDTNAIGTGSRIQIYKLAATKVKDIIVTNNTTQVDLWDLDITPDSEYLLVSDVSNGSGTGAQLGITVNDVTSNSSYYRQRIRGDGSSASALRANDARVLDMLTGVKGLAYSHIKLSNIGAYTSQNYAMLRQGTSSIFLQNHFISSTSEAITSITKINLVGSATNTIGAGSRFMLYKLY